MILPSLLIPFRRISSRDRLSVLRERFLLLSTVISRRLHLIKSDLRDFMMENVLKHNDI